MKKIAIDCSRLNILYKSGTHRFLISFLKELVKREGFEFTFYFNQLDSNLVDYEFLKSGKIVKLNQSFYTQIGLLKELGKYDYFIFPWQTVPFLSFLTGGCVISIIHDSGYSFKTKLFTFLTQIFSNKLFSVSKNTADSLFVKSSTITEGVDSEVFFKIKENDLTKLRFQHNLPDKFILTVGRVEERKNIYTNLKAFSLIHNLYPSLKYCFVGKIELDEGSLYSYIDSLNIDRGRIVFKNYLDDKELNIYLNSCEFLVFTSQEEGFGLPVLEAYKVGKWVLLSQIKQLAEFKLTARQVVHFNKPAEIADAIVYFLSNKNMLKKEFDPENVLIKYSWKNSVDLFLKGLNL